VKLAPLVAGAVCAASLGLAVAASWHAGTAASSPVRPDGGWSPAWTTAIVVSLLAYGAGILIVSRQGAPLAAVLGLAAAVQLVPLAAPLLLSTDAYTYWDYGRIGAVHDANPYDVPPNRFPDDPAFTRMGASWHGSTSLYGPAFTLASEAQAALAGDSADAAAWSYKALAGAAMLAVTGLTALLAVRRAFAAVFVGWNPLLALHFAGGGHNDAWMMALLLLGLVLDRRGRPLAGGVAWGVAIGVKWVPLVLYPLHALGERGRRRAVSLAGLAAGLALVAVAAFARYGLDWLSAFSGLSHQARRTGSIGFSQLLGDLGLPHRAILVLLALAFVAFYAWLVVQARRGRPRLGLAAGGFALAQGWLNPWYAVWAIPLAAAEDDRAAQWLSLGLTAYLLRDALPL
jgi:alpha-1,6-mannosyltransferase